MILLSKKEFFFSKNVNIFMQRGIFKIFLVLVKDYRKK